MQPRVCTMKTKCISLYENQENKKKISNEITDRKGDIERENSYTKKKKQKTMEIIVNRYTAKI